MVKDPNCKNKNWKMDDLDKIIFDEIKKIGNDPKLIQDIRDDSKNKKTEDPNKIVIIEREIDKIDTTISRFMDLYGAGTFSIDQVNSKVQPLNEKRKGLLKELEALNVAEGRLSVEEAFKIAEAFADVLEEGEFSEIRSTIEHLIYYIEVDNEQYKIHWKFA